MRYSHTVTDIQVNIQSLTLMRCDMVGWCCVCSRGCTVYTNMSDASTIRVREAQILRLAALMAKHSDIKGPLKCMHFHHSLSSLHRFYPFIPLHELILFIFSSISLHTQPSISSSLHAGLGSLLVGVRPVLSVVSKAKAGKIVKAILDAVFSVDGRAEDKVMTWRVRMCSQPDLPRV